MSAAVKCELQRIKLHWSMLSSKAPSLWETRDSSSSARFLFRLEFIPSTNDAICNWVCIIIRVISASDSILLFSASHLSASLDLIISSSASSFLSSDSQRVRKLADVSAKRSEWLEPPTESQLSGSERFSNSSSRLLDKPRPWSVYLWRFSSLVALRFDPARTSGSTICFVKR